MQATQEMIARRTNVKKLIQTVFIYLILINFATTLDTRKSTTRLLAAKPRSTSVDSLGQRGSESVIDIDGDIDKILAEVSEDSLTDSRADPEPDPDIEQPSKKKKVKEPRPDIKESKVKKAKGSSEPHPFKKSQRVLSGGEPHYSLDEIRNLKVSKRKLTLMALAVGMALFFWGVFVQWALDKSKRSTIELRIIEKQADMTPIERMLYENNLKKKKQEWKEKQDISLD